MHKTKTGLPLFAQPRQSGSFTQPRQPGYPDPGIRGFPRFRHLCLWLGEEQRAPPDFVGTGVPRLLVVWLFRARLPFGYLISKCHANKLLFYNLLKLNDILTFPFPREISSSENCLRRYEIFSLKDLPPFLKLHLSAPSRNSEHSNLIRWYAC